MQETDFITFQNYVKEFIKGDEKGEAQIFLDHFFTALGFSNGLKGAGANCEFRIKDDKKNSTKFADLVWKPIVLIEMKKRNTDLSLHYQQAFDYWTKLVPNRPQYVILCNFDEFWIYDLNVQVYEPLEKVKIEQIHEKSEVFSFMYPKPRNPIFNYNKEEVTEKAAYFVSFIYRSMINRKIEPNIALKYCMQMVLTMFAEDIELLPNHIFTRLIKDLLKEPGEGPDTVTKSYDLISGLFTAMNTEGIANGGMYKDVEYFNGGLFDKIYPIELTKHELTLIDQAASYNWRKINPAIFGSLFEFALDTKERHKLGAHYTHEIDIKKIVVPVIVRPWLEKIEKAENLNELYALLEELSNFKVLDPACGSGNFLFVAFKEMKLLEKTILFKIRERSKKPVDAKRLMQFLWKYKYVSTNQFYGIDIKSFAVELAKVTLIIAKELIWLENREDYDNKDKPLPLDNLEHNIVCADALFPYYETERLWRDADAIIGNPPYQSKNKMQKEFGRKYVSELRYAFPEISGHADFCVYWFYKTHKYLKEGCYAGLVGTNTIRENFSRQSGLDYIVSNNGTIINAVSTQPWSGVAAVSVSIVNWVKGQFDSKKTLYYLNNKNEWDIYELDYINSSLSFKTDVKIAQKIIGNQEPKTCFQGHTHAYSGFLLTIDEAKKLIEKNQQNKDVIKPFLIGNELVGNINSQPKRFVIDFSEYTDLASIQKYKDIYSIIEKKVLPEISKKAEIERKETNKSGPRQNHLNRWWQFWAVRHELMKTLKGKKMYIACSRVMLRPIFEFMCTDIVPNDKIIVFPFDDYYSFGIIQSKIHWEWLKTQCTTLENRYNYNLTIWETFPWPQTPTIKQIETIATITKELHIARNEVLKNGKISLRELFRTFEKPGKNKIKDLQDKLDYAVNEAYGLASSSDILQQLLALNLELVEKEKNKQKIQKPGIPEYYVNKQNLISNDCVCFDTNNNSNKII